LGSGSPKSTQPGDGGFQRWTFDCRKAASQLITHGYGTEVWFWPIGFMIDESNMISARDNARIKLEATLIQQAIGSVFGQEGRKLFQSTLNDIYVESELRSASPGEKNGKQPA
jgi:hypothetical protein